MKILIPGSVLSGLSLVMLALAGEGSLQNATAQTPPAPAALETSAQPETPVTPPPDIYPTSPLAQVVRLTQAGVDQGIIMTYVTNSASTFNLDSEKIIYLTNLGAPNSLITAMMQRDLLLQQQFATAQAAQQAQQLQPPATTQGAPAPAPEAAPAGTADVTAPPAPVTVNYFYDTLSPYGSWVVINGYGRCWRPTVCVYNPGWQPYCDQGHWVYTDCGWYWASSYAWGATFHYGRWFQNASFGWCWYPDTAWAPSWVTWRYSNNYCGWAPLPPGTTYQAGVGIVYNGGNVSVGFSFGLGASCFTFVPTQYFCSAHPRNYCAPPSQVTQIYNNTTVINNYNNHNHTIVNRGIEVQNIAAVTRTPIHEVPVRQINEPAFRDWHNQPSNRPGYDSRANRPAYQGYYSSPGQQFAATQNHFPATANQNPQPGRNWSVPQPNPSAHNTVVAVNPQRPVLPAGNYLPTHEAPVQAPPANYNQQPTAGNWQHSPATGTPRYLTRPEVRQNYSAPASASVPEHSAPAYAPAPAQSQPQPGGFHGGNQNWPGH